MHKHRKNQEEAVKWYKKAAEKGNAWDMYQLGRRYYNEKNYTEAIKWLEKAAEKGNDSAATLLRDCYDHSNQKDEAEAEKE